MTADDLVGLFADETRVRAFAAVALGARSTSEVADRAGLPLKGAALALRRLQDREVITTDDTGLMVAYDHFRHLVRERSTSVPTQDHGSGDEHVESVLRTFVRDGRLIRLPAQWTRKKFVLRYIAEQTFRPGIDYSEQTVNDRLREWCDGGGLDHVTLRRYLVDLHHLHRRDGRYWRPADDGAPAD
ncbi:DUF2087 domain-containing protein [Streptomyces sp. NPDC001020]